MAFLLFWWSFPYYASAKRAMSRVTVAFGEAHQPKYTLTRCSRVACVNAIDDIRVQRSFISIFGLGWEENSKGYNSTSTADFIILKTQTTPSVVRHRWTDFLPNQRVRQKGHLKLIPRAMYITSTEPNFPDFKVRKSPPSLPWHHQIICWPWVEIAKDLDP